MSTEFESQEEVLKIIAESWAEINKRPEERQGGKGFGSSQEKKTKSQEQQDMEAIAANRNQKDQVPEKKGFFARFSGGGSKKSEAKGGYNTLEEKGETAETSNNKTGTGEKKFDMPETFEEMVKLNAAMTGANMTYIQIVLDEFKNIVRDVLKFGQLQEQTDILAMRISKDVKDAFKTSEFKVCMLASMRSFIPAIWDTKHEQAWLWLWESIDVQLKKSLEMPVKYERPVDRWVSNLERDERRKMAMNVWNKMFHHDPEAERVFKQSNERLIFIVEKAFEFSAKIYQEPSKTKEEIQGLGLRHIMFGARPQNFSLFVQCVKEEMIEQEVDEIVVSGLHWSISVIACTMARTVEEGSTPLLMAALSNNVKELKKVLGQQPRGSRAKACLFAESTIKDEQAKADAASVASSS